MRVLIQRVLQASVVVDKQCVSHIDEGLLILLGIGLNDNQQAADYLVQKISKLRIFNDENGVMNLSVTDVKAQCLVVSQFTLQAQTQKGNRPSYTKAAPPDVAKPLVDYFVNRLSQAIGQVVKTGIFGADMQVSLINNGPVTIWIDSEAK